MYQLIPNNEVSKENDRQDRHCFTLSYFKSKFSYVLGLPTSYSMMLKNYQVILIIIKEVGRGMIWVCESCNATKAVIADGGTAAIRNAKVTW